jgi:hypothetical protein
MVASFFALLFALVLASCTAGTGPTPPGGSDGGTSDGGTDSGIPRNGCRSGFPKTSDPCTQGESCTGEGTCSSGGSLPHYSCGPDNRLFEDSRTPCPVRPGTDGGE